MLLTRLRARHKYDLAAKWSGCDCSPDAGVAALSHAGNFNASELARGTRILVEI